MQTRNASERASVVVRSGLLPPTEGDDVYDEAAAVHHLEPSTDLALRDALALFVRHLQPDGIADDDSWRHVFEDAAAAFSQGLGDRRLRLVDAAG
jgi:hypothetical protein